LKILAGTSGFAFKEWKGPFYPDDLKNDDMLRFYSAQFPTVEINNTFYRLPKESVLQDWATQVPEQFCFAIKASQRITHFLRLKPESAELVEYLCRTTSALGHRLGPILFQLPPNMKKDMDRLRPFLAKLPQGRRFAMEFRHESWFEDDVYAALREHDVALGVIEQADFKAPLQSTASWGYVRLHRMDYTNDELADWANRLYQQRDWAETFVFFKHDHAPQAGSGPPAVAAFLKACAA
jgi:uncharacterized protein YecE (DUF72 family)